MEQLRTLYEENGRFYRYFLDWRFRILVRYGIALGATLVIAKFAFESTVLAAWTASLPFLFFALASFACFLFDRKNTVMTDHILATGKRLEQELNAESSEMMREQGGFFTQQMDCRINPKTPSYALVLSVIYSSSSVASFLAAVAVFIYALL